MTRVDDLTANVLPAEIRRTRDDLNTLKASQQVGAPNIKVYRNSSNAPYDKALTVAANTTQGFTLIFTANKQPDAKATITYQMFLDAAMTIEVRRGDYTSPIAPDLKVIPQIYSDSQPLASKWVITAYNNEATSRTYYFKFNVQSTDQGVIAAI